MSLESARILPYLGVFVAAILEGEVVFVTACVLVGLGKLDPVGVLVAGALGGSAGDQAYFYLFHGRLRHWLERIEAWQRHRHRLDNLVSRHANKIIFACRFLPGMRILIQAACAHAGVSCAKFTILSLISAFVWAGAILILVSYGGPDILERLGIRAWWSPVLAAGTVAAILFWIRTRVRRELENH